MLDGYTLVKLVRERLTPAARLVAITGYGSLHEHDRALAAGFDDHIRKPVRAEALRDLVQSTSVALGEPRAIRAR